MKHHHAHNSLLVLALLVFLVTVSLYVYMYNAVNSQTRKVVIAKDIQKVQKLDNEQIGELQKLFNHSEPARDKLKGLFVTKAEVIKFIESLESIGTVTGALIEITTINEVKEEDGSLVKKVRAHFEAKGTWSQVSKTLAFVETMQKSITLDAVRFNSNGASTDGTKGGSWNLSMDITANLLP